MQLDQRKDVAVAAKFFLQDGEQNSNKSISQLLEVSKQSNHLEYAYYEIRKEVSILSKLCHKNLNKLCGVLTKPFMCLMSELAPKNSLRTILKQYKECSLTLEPCTLKITALQVCNCTLIYVHACAKYIVVYFFTQIAEGLDCLHSNQIAHLDMKSPNILIWQFPSPHDSLQVRMKEAAHVLVKIADYGTSQGSASLTLMVKDPPVGTPGYIPPEVFHKVGQVISSEKVILWKLGDSED